MNDISDSSPQVTRVTSDLIEALHNLAPEVDDPRQLYERLASSEGAQERLAGWTQEKESDAETEATRRVLLPILLAVEEKYIQIPRQYPFLFTRCFGRLNHLRKPLPEEWIELNFPGLPQLRPQGAPTAIDNSPSRPGTVYRIEPHELALQAPLTGNQADSAKQLSVVALGMAESFVQAEEVLHANVLNTGLSCVASAGDGEALFSERHPYRDGVYSNLLEPRCHLNEAALELAAKQIRHQFVDAAGLRLYARPRLLVVPIEREFTAARLFAAEDCPLASKMEGYRVLDYLNDREAWFVTTSVHGLRSVSWKPFRLDLKIDSGALRLEATQTYGCGYTNPRACLASFPKP